ncbi:MAG: ABC transporter ATP-binding protein, partial [Candidatus Electrothrix sp. ATG2]|nr:ABC transporter ATP-binding protein [Candidatus Electrothrix sp. ATG2]
VWGVVEQGRVEEVMQNPRHPYTKALLSAVPTIGQDGREIIRLSGEMPSPSHPPTGCHFNPRCPQAMPQCRERYPDALAVGEQHRVRCFLAG